MVGHDIINLVRKRGVFVMEQIRPISVGVEFCKRMIDGGYYYIDKTLLIRDILLQKDTVTLFILPRPFSKTLAQSMLKVFFEKEILPNGTVMDNSRYFKGKKIMKMGDGFTSHLVKYLVIFLSLKSAKQQILKWHMIVSLMK